MKNADEKHRSLDSTRGIRQVFPKTVTIVTLSICVLVLLVVCKTLIFWNSLRSFTYLSSYWTLWRPNWCPFLLELTRNEKKSLSCHTMSSKTPQTRHVQAFTESSRSCAYKRFWLWVDSRGLCLSSHIPATQEIRNLAPIDTVASYLFSFQENKSITVTSIDDKLWQMLKWTNLTRLFRLNLTDSTRVKLSNRITILHTN